MIDQHLQAHTVNAPENLLSAAKELADRLGLTSVPEICTTAANVSPMVWWVGGRIRVVLPSSWFRQMEPSEWRWVLAHELARVYRRDHVVRWLEWLAIVVFWWNPLVWWAQRNLRVLEEICCDDLVISRLKAEPHSYAESILTAIESVATPTVRPPAMASGINSGGILERRFKMMIENRVGRLEPRWLRAGVLLTACVVLPLGVTYAQDYEAVGKRLRAAVAEGELTGKQARIMLDALRRAEGRGEKAEDRITREDFAAAEKKMRRPRQR